MLFLRVNERKLFANVNSFDLNGTFISSKIQKKNSFDYLALLGLRESNDLFKMAFYLQEALTLLPEKTL